jgi:hypothetical protein
MRIGPCSITLYKASVKILSTFTSKESILIKLL